jgi:hypothetical protein
MELIHLLLAPTSSGVDQQATRSPPIQSGATSYPSCLKSSQGVSPFMKVTVSACSGTWKHIAVMGLSELKSAVSHSTLGLHKTA